MVSARRDLGPEYDAALAESFVERVESRLEQRVAEATTRRLKRSRAGQNKQLVLAITSVVMGVPISAFSAGFADLPGLLVSWAGIVGVNLAHAWKRS